MPYDSTAWLCTDYDVSGSKLLTLPIMSWAKKVENKEREKQFKVKQEVIGVKKQYKGEEAFRKIDAIL